MAAVPDWYPFGEETKPAPVPLLRLQAFLNTRSLEDDADLLTDLDGARAWLTDAGLLPAGSRLTPSELDRSRRIREAIRGVLDGTGDEHSLEPLRALAKSRRPRLNVGPGGALALENPQHDDLGDGLFELLLIMRAAQQDGTWERLRACSNPDCEWVFYDRSRNRQGSWCEMAVCGNRLKNRRLRARRR